MKSEVMNKEEAEKEKASSRTEKLPAEIFQWIRPIKNTAAQNTETDEIMTEKTRTMCDMLLASPRGCSVHHTMNNNHINDVDFRVLWLGPSPSCLCCDADSSRSRGYSDLCLSLGCFDSDSDLRTLCWPWHTPADSFPTTSGGYVCLRPRMWVRFWSRPLWSCNSLLAAVPACTIRQGWSFTLPKFYTRRRSSAVRQQ